jgi:hypothetical protein
LRLRKIVEAALTPHGVTCDLVVDVVPLHGQAVHRLKVRFVMSHALLVRKGSDVPGELIHDGWLLHGCNTILLVNSLAHVRVLGGQRRIAQQVLKSIAAFLDATATSRVREHVFFG